MARPPSSRTVLSPLSRRLVAGLLIAAGILLVVAQLLRVYVLFYHWHDLGQLAWRPMLGVVLGTAAGALTSYVGWRVGRAG